MRYREYLVMRTAIAWLAAVQLALWLLTLVLAFGAKRGTGVDHVTLENSLGLSTFLLGIFASIFGVALGNGSRDASRVLWMLPAPRWRSALDIIVVDLLGITAGFAIIMILGGLFDQLLGVMFSAPGSTFSWQVHVGHVARALAFTFAVYGWGAALGMIARRMSYGGLLVIPILIVWQLLAQTQSHIGAFFRTLILLNPIALISNVGTPFGCTRACDPVTRQLLWLTPSASIEVLLAIAIGTCAIAVALWQRAEVLA